MKKTTLAILALLLFSAPSFAAEKWLRVDDYIPPSPPVNLTPYATDAELAGHESDTTPHPTLIGPNIQGKVLRSGTAVNDDDCTGEQGNWWWDSTDSKFEFCNANAGAPVTIPDCPAITTNSKAAAYTVGTDNLCECYGGVVYVTSAATITACDNLAAEMNFTVITIGAIAVSVDPQNDDLVVRDGTAQTDGQAITNTSTAGDIATCSYYSVDGWYCATNGWTGP